MCSINKSLKKIVNIVRTEWRERSAIGIVTCSAYNAVHYCKNWNEAQEWISCYPGDESSLAWKLTSFGNCIYTISARYYQMVSFFEMKFQMLDHPTHFKEIE